LSGGWFKADPAILGLELFAQIGKIEILDISTFPARPTGRFFALELKSTLLFAG
jgi:hypothetical protein